VLGPASAHPATPTRPAAHAGEPGGLTATAYTKAMCNLRPSAAAAFSSVIRVADSEL